ncbi:argininosuccinate lyase [Robiginitomaculum antarcticum]|uniref:argininosuccinate lyase n=1 Tax=Robiginitomaculum antarcticum TaxID=437507 RepID=UPI00037D62B0|nr:argininosuccinate lyase [Robiginitomaculum antarcticum]
MGQSDSKKAGQTMWGGRFSDNPSEIMQAINVSIDFDRRLYAQDIEGSLAHSEMLAACGIITSDDKAAIHRGLHEIKDEIEAGDFPWSAELEDIHLNIEGRLKDKIGEAAGRLHTGRSRNDQVATDFRLWTREHLNHFVVRLGGLMSALLAQAEQNTDTVMPGFTHLQSAQPVTFGHHMLAYLEMFARDRSRFEDARARMNESPLGAAALAGTPYPIDRDMTARALGFDRPMANSLDAVSARDFALEALSAATICATHLSRLAEEIVIWTSAQFGFITLSDKFTTGSSIMPQKRNPDAAELIRAKVGRIMGALTTLTIVMKGLPLAYSKDMQEDKEPVFDAFEALDLALAAMTGMIGDMTPRKDRLADAAGAGFSTATDLADWLVRSLNMPFREAHHVTGVIVALAEKQGTTLDALPLSDMQAIHAEITQDVYSVLTPLASARSRLSYGGTSPVRVAEQVARWKDKLS